MPARIGNLIADDLGKLWVFTGSRVVLFSELKYPESGYPCDSLDEALDTLVSGGYVQEPAAVDPCWDCNGAGYTPQCGMEPPPCA